MAHRVNNYSKVKTSRRIILHKNKLFLVACYFRAACVSSKSALNLYYVYVTGIWKYYSFKINYFINTIIILLVMNTIHLISIIDILIINDSTNDINKCSIYYSVN